MFISPPVLGAIAPLPLLFACVLADTSSGSPSSSSVVPTKNYIDTISGYDDLSTCAENVLSTIVRAQSSGCGDNGAVTSYSCFCTDSSSHFSYEITSAVSATCDSAIAPEQASSAIRVFDAYCALGVKAGLARITAPSTASATGTATPAASASASSTTATATPSARGKSGGGSSSDPAGINSAIIAAAVIVPVCAIGLGLMWCLLWRRRRRETRRSKIEKQRELDDMSSREAPPRRIETIRATTEFKWPARIGDASYASSRMTQLQEEEQQQQQHQHHQQQQQHEYQYQQQEQQHHHHPPYQQPSPSPPPPTHQQLQPEKELLFVNSPTAASFHSTGTTLPTHFNPEYHISPEPYTHKDYQRHEELKHKYPAQGLHQTEPAELPHHDLPELFQEEKPPPQELPAGSLSPPMFPQELEGSVSPETPRPRPPRSRFSYQT